MKIKNLVVTILLISITLFCSACGNSTDKESGSESTKTQTSNAEKETESPEAETSDQEKVAEAENLYGEKTLDEIKEDLQTSDLIPMEFGTDDDYHIESVELIKRNTTESTDEVYCTITVNSGSSSTIQDYKLTYNHYTTGGWILDEYSATSEQTYLPLLGVDEFTVAYSISEIFGYNCDYEIIDQDTDFDSESLSDSVKVRISMDGSLFKASGTLTFNYTYLGGWWNLVDYIEESDYTEYYDFVGTWVCDYANNGKQIRLFLVREQNGNSLTGDYIQLRITADLSQVSVIENFEGKPFTVRDDGSIFWDSQGYTVFYYDKDTVMETDNTPFIKYSDSYMTMDEYISANYSGYSIH